MSIWAAAFPMICIKNCSIISVTSTSFRQYTAPTSLTCAVLSSDRSHREDGTTAFPCLHKKLFNYLRVLLPEAFSNTLFLFLQGSPSYNSIVTIIMTSAVLSSRQKSKKKR